MGPMSEKITVGYNGTASSAEAVRWAADEAAAQGAALRIVRCVESPPMADGAALGFGAGEAYAAAHSTAEADAGRIRMAIASSHPGVLLTVEVVPGPAATALLEGLDHGDLVVAGASSHDGAAAFWLGTTPRQLVRHSPCPVAVVRGAASRGAPDRIVVGIDGSPASATAVRWAADEADRHGVELVVVHAWHYPYESAEIGSAQARDLTEIDAACTLDRMVEAARERCAAVVTAVLVKGGPVTALLDTTRDGDILVVGSRGRGALRSRFFGSTVNGVLEAAAVPVVIIRADPDETTAALPDSEPTRASV